MSRIERKITLKKDVPPELGRLLKAVGKGDKTAVGDLQAQFTASPELYRHLFDLNEMVTGLLVDSFGGSDVTSKLVSLPIEAQSKSLQNELGYENSPALERMLIHTVINAWLRLQWTEIRCNEVMKTNHAVHAGIYWQKALTGASNRYLRAIETLARVRRLARADPALQLNIAYPDGQQVNLSGNVVVNK